MLWTVHFSFGDQLILTVYVHKLECLVKSCFAVFKVKVTVKVLNFSECLARKYLIDRYIIISQSIIQKYNFAMFKVKATIISTRSSEIFKLLQPKLVYGTWSQDEVRHCEKIFLLLLRVWDGGYGMKKIWREHCFCNEYTCLLSLLVCGSSVRFLYPFVLVMVST